MTKLPLAGRSAVVTGSARGLGKAIAQRFAEEGARVLLVDLREPELNEVLAEDWAQDCVGLALDLTAPDAADQVAEAALKAFGKIDVLVNNAGIALSGTIEEIDEAKWDRVLLVNLTVPYRLCRRIVPEMAAAGYGRVINISSMNASMGMRQDAAYSASKAGIEALSRSIAADYGPRGVTANTIAPGTIETPLNSDILRTWGDESALKQIVLINKPVPGNGSPNDIAHAAAFLASDQARYVSAQCITVDGGLTGTRFVPDPQGLKTAQYHEKLSD